MISWMSLAALMLGPVVSIPGDAAASAVTRTERRRPEETERHPAETLTLAHAFVQ